MYIPMHVNNLPYMRASMLGCYADTPLGCIDLWFDPDIDLYPHYLLILPPEGSECQFAYSILTPIGSLKYLS